MENKHIVMLIIVVLALGLLIGGITGEATKRRKQSPGGGGGGGSGSVSCIDSDNDGFYSRSRCGTLRDCNDNDVSIRPNFPELCGDNIDNNCDNKVDDWPNCPFIITKENAIYPEADAYVREDLPDKKFGAEFPGSNFLYVRSPGEGKEMIAYLRFNVLPEYVSFMERNVHSEITIQIANLYMTYHPRSSDRCNGNTNQPCLKLLSFSNSIWNETEITWNNRPLVEGNLIDFKESLPYETYYTFDLSSLITSPGKYNLALIGGYSLFQNSFEFRSKESDDIKSPWLDLIYCIDGDGKSNNSKLFRTSAINNTHNIVDSCESFQSQYVYESYCKNNIIKRELIYCGDNKTCLFGGVCG